MTYKNITTKECTIYTHTENNAQWNIQLLDISNFSNYMRCRIICNENCFYTYIGLSDNELWICFPYIEKSTILSTIHDIEWNTNELYRVLKNKADAISIATAIMELESIINNQK